MRESKSKIITYLPRFVDGNLMLVKTRKPSYVLHDVILSIGSLFIATASSQRRVQLFDLATGIQFDFLL